MNRFESMLENNPLRSYVREKMEVQPLRAATDVGCIERALHVACGDGGSTQLILKHFLAHRMSGVDRDPALIAEARKRRGSETVDYTVQDVCSLDFGDGVFDAVFDLADLHNYRDWRKALEEIGRVLRPGGLLILEELSLESFQHAAGKLFKIMTDHPYDSMLTAGGLRDHVAQTGFQILHFQERNPLGLLKYYTMVARKM